MFLLSALIVSSVPWIRFGNPGTFYRLFMCTICRLVQRTLYIKDVSLLYMTLRSLFSWPRIRTTQRLPPQRSTRTKKQHGQLSTKPK